MKINGFYLFLLLFLFVIVLSSLYEPLRYLKYTLPLVPLLVYFNRKTFFTNQTVWRYYSTFLIFYSVVILYLLCQNLLNDDFSSRFIPNAVFILSPLIFAILLLPYFQEEKVHKYITAIVAFNLLVFLYEEGHDLIQVVTNLDILKSALFSSEIPTENQLAFVFGFLVIYFMMENYNKWYLLISIVIFILCFKRIVIAAVCICAVSYFLIRIFRADISKRRKTWTLVGVAVNLIYIQLTQLIVSGTFDKAVEEKTGISTDQFLMGRKTFYTAAFEEAGPISWSGLGLGKMDDIIFEFYGQKMNLHSEILKNYFEFGAVIFMVWLVLILYKNLFSNKAAIFFLYLNILMLTDNVFIYFEIMFYFYFFILIVLHQQGERSKIQTL